MPEGSYTIHVGSDADLGGLDKAEAALKRSDQAAAHFIETLKLGVGIDLGGRLVSSIAELPGKFEELVQRGIAFNAEMSDSELAIAKIIGRFQGLNDVAAKGEAGKAMAQIVELEPRTAGTLQSLVQGFSATAASSLSAGLSIKENIDLVAKFANVASNIKLPQEQLPQELRSILSGNITADSAIAKTLNISNDDIAKAKQLGTLYSFLTEKIGGLGEAGDSNAVRVSSLQSAIDKLLASATKPIFDEINDGLLTLTEELNKPETATALKELGHDVAALVADGVKLTAWAIENADALVAVAKGATTLAVAYAAIKLKDLLVGLAGMTVNMLRSTTAVEAETVALGANTAAQAANTAARRANGGAATMRSLAAGAMIPADMIGTGAPATATATAKGGGFLGAPSLAGVLGAANIGVILGMLAKAGLEKYAASVSADNENRQAKGKEATDGVMSAKDRLAGLKSASERDLFDRDLGGEITQLESKKNAKGQDRGLIEQQIKAYEQMRAAAAKLGEEDFKRAGAAQAAAAAAKEEESTRAATAEAEAKNATALADYRNARGDAFTTSQRGDRTDAALDAAGKATDPAEASAALRNRIAELQTELQSKPAITDNKTPLADVQRRDSDRDAIRSQIEQLKKAETDARENAAKKDAEDVKTREKDNNDDAVKGLESQRSLIESLGKERIAQVEAAGGSENDIAAKRKQIEDDIASQRLAIEDKIGLLQGESDTERQARHATAQADALQRETELQSKARETAAQSSEDAWQRSAPRSGRIDGRSQRTIGAGGDVLVDQGRLAPGVTRDAAGQLVEPSRLGASIGSQPWFDPAHQFPDPAARQAALSPSNLLPPTKPAEIGQANNQTAQAVAKVEPAVQGLITAVEKFAADIKTATSKLNSAGGKAVQEISSIGAAVADNDKQLASAIGEANKAIKNVQGEITHAREAV